MAKINKYIHQLFDDNLIEVLQQRKIYTIIDFLQIDLEKLVHITNLPYKDILTLQKAILNKYAAVPQNGLDYYNNLMENTAIVSTGIKSLDLILDGGMLTGNIIEICGLSGSCKTQLCHTLAVNIAQNLKLQVHYVDTKKDFSGRRIQAMLEARHCKEEEMATIMEQIQVSRIKNVYEVLTLFHKMKLKMQTQNRLRLVIIDSLPSLFLPFHGERKYNTGLLHHLVNIMKFMANQHHVVFCLVNLITRWVDPEDVEDKTNFQTETLTPALGKYWQTIPSIRLMLKNNEENDNINISVIKSTTTNTGSNCNVEITERGVI